MTLRKVYKKIRKVIIYEIVCNITGERYIGSTISSISKRLELHRRNSHCSSINIINRGNYKVNILETFNTRFQLIKLLKEQYYLDNINNINYLRAFSSRKKKDKKRKNQISNICICGGKYKSYTKCKHIKSNIHIKYEVSAVLENIIAILEK